MIDIRAAFKTAYAAAVAANAGNIKACAGCYTVQFFEAVKAGFSAEAIEAVAKMFGADKVDAYITRGINNEMGW